MARELSATHTRMVISGDTSNPSSAELEYRVLNADGVNDDLLESPAKSVVDSPDFNQTVAAFCAAGASTAKTTEGIS